MYLNIFRIFIYKNMSLSRSIIIRVTENVIQSIQITLSREPLFLFKLSANKAEIMIYFQIYSNLHSF